MKNKELLRAAAMVFGLFLFMGCSKSDPFVENPTVTTKSNNSPTNNDKRLAPKHYGYIAGLLVPVPMKASVIAYNDAYTSAEVNPAADGTFIINDLVPGVYTVRVDYIPFGSDVYSTFTIERIVVVAGTVTDLGSINLD